MSKAKKTNKKDSFVTKLNTIFGSEAEEIIDVLKLAQLKTFRINLNVVDPVNILGHLKSQGFEIKKGPFENSYIVTNQPENLKLSETDEVNSGQIYIQNLSSMLPVLLLNPKTNEKILDLCAAPGSKTTQIAEITKDESEIVAIEKNKNRFFKLKENLESRNHSNVKLHLTDGTRLINYYPEYENYFDKVLVDAVCSGEGTIRLNNSDTLKFWNKNKFKQFSNLQKALIANAIKMLKPGGTLVYSTCTFSPEENELIIDWALKNFKNLKIEEILEEEVPIDNKVSGLTKWKKKILSSELNKTIRIIPTQAFEGFYVAKMRKIRD
jgi:NOL1/NOP2/sun family putative RNA methylase